MSRPHRNRNARLRVLNLNTHVGNSLRNGPDPRNPTVGSTLDRLLRRRRPFHVILLQEIRRNRFAQLRKMLGENWDVHGTFDMAVCLDNRRFETLSVSIKNITYGENHTRHAVEVCALDLLTGRVCYFQSLHCQPLGRGLEHANPAARTRQTRQLTHFADRSATREDDAVVIDGGDVNQPVWKQPSSLPAKIRPASVHVIYNAAGMDALRDVADGDDTATLDEFFVRADPHLTGLRRRVVPCNGPGDDHDAVILTATVLAHPGDTA